MQKYAAKTVLYLALNFGRAWFLVVFVTNVTKRKCFVFCQKKKNILFSPSVETN